MSNAESAATDSKPIMRDKRAQGIAAMGLVTRECDRFSVATPSLRGRTVKYEVWRDGAGRVRCSCLEYEEHASEDATFRCEHILAVKHSLIAKNVPPASNVRSLAKHTNPEEQEMNDKQNRIAITQGSENTDPELALSVESVAPVVPLAFTNTLRALRHQIDSAVVKTRKAWTDHEGDARIVEYVEWYTVVDILDRNAPDWSHSVRNVVLIGDIVAVTAAITIHGVTREGVGTGTARNAMGIKQAEHDALKRAAVKFGIARELEERESELIEEEGTASQGHSSTDPLATSMADLVTPRQLGMIRALARVAGLDVEEECQSVYRCQSDELSKRAASSVIDHLRSLQQVAAAGMRRAS